MRCWLINGDDTQLLTSIFPKCVKLFVVVVLGEINCVGVVDISCQSIAYYQVGFKDTSSTVCHMNVLFMPCKLKENGEILAGLRVDCPVVKFLFFLKKKIKI